MRFTHGGDIYGYSERHKSTRLLDFSANINPFGMPESIKTAALAAVDGCINYPDPHCRELRRAISEHEGYPPGWIFCGNGSADVLYRIAAALRPKRVLVMSPSFSEFTGAFHLRGCEIRYHLLRERESFAVTDAVFGKLSGLRAGDAVCLCNPNNPTGGLIDTAILRELLRRCGENGIYLIEDECFNDFLEEPEANTLKHELAENPKLVILRSFTKMYALPGVRLGYCATADTELITRLYTAGQPWPVSVIAGACGVAALKEDKFALECRAYITRERERLTAGLRELGATVYDGAANYLFFRSNLMSDLAYALKKHGILIRRCEDYVGLDNRYFRVAVRLADEDDILLAELSAIVRRERSNWQKQ
jgi:threonine-phosphate decarboxylase